MKIEFPKYIYNADGQTKMVMSPDELAEAGADWKESPAEFKQDDKKKSAEPKK